MSDRKRNVPFLSIVGSSGVGKTTLLENLIPELTQLGLKVGTIKHHSHEFEIDKPGKDSWRHKRAGAHIAMISSPEKIGLVIEADHDHHPEELAHFFTHMDLIITEGYKRAGNPKIEVFRSEVHSEVLCQGDEHLLAVVTDATGFSSMQKVPKFGTADIKGLANFIIKYFDLIPTKKEPLGKAES